mmetsp:Transcript_24511/g.39480  ORF Transcript_24511/g.39480 Transcript_24511/m.39480 type:complete len:80 (+) Transcript_24511:201-440(+)|eukprot:CAMPEP_0173119100 /NCGR_PEP_ID=MMETSP1102-20130122/51538_1 /TAXON_ID=49646 /ORGANISM="Geminigera sp., Strain Caron Lab Isolate" /LENGTH=79 /DNA_ID=CAMNT_0014024549 /DNA_START=79 /DNA_END=318 /DNA_ORIENTATION=+
MKLSGISVSLVAYEKFDQISHRLIATNLSLINPAHGPGSDSDLDSDEASVCGASLSLRVAATHRMLRQFHSDASVLARI